MVEGYDDPEAILSICGARLQNPRTSNGALGLVDNYAVCRVIRPGMARLVYINSERWA